MLVFSLLLRISWYALDLCVWCVLPSFHSASFVSGGDLCRRTGAHAARSTSIVKNNSHTQQLDARINGCLLPLIPHAIASRGAELRPRFGAQATLNSYWIRFCSCERVQFSAVEQFHGREYRFGLSTHVFHIGTCGGTSRELAAFLLTHILQLTRC